MHVSYDDITSRIAEPPLWWSNGVPRYEPFEPAAISVYADFAVRLRVECQACAGEFHVGMAGPHPGFPNLTTPGSGALTYVSDDPPHHERPKDGLSCTGNTMGWMLLEVMEVWARNAKSDWVRRRELEGPRA